MLDVLLCFESNIIYGDRKSNRINVNRYKSFKLPEK